MPPAAAVPAPLSPDPPAEPLSIFPQYLVTLVLTEDEAHLPNRLPEPRPRRGSARWPPNPRYNALACALLGVNTPLKI
eukprot:651483-Pelagomonas_calceolata.AAC.9